MMEKSLRPYSVLVVEDNPFEGKLILGIMQAFEFGRVLGHSNVDDAIDEMKRTKVDCVVVDWHMPHRPGIELVRHIRRSDQSVSADLPIILCTGYTEYNRIVQARDAGVDEILAKPYAAADLYRRLYAAIFKTRPFVTVDGYTGPDRRRLQRDFDGHDRRGTLGLSQDQIDNLMTPVAGAAEKAVKGSDQ